MSNALWDWFEQYERQASEDDAPQRVRLPRLFRDAPAPDRDPARTLSMFDEGLTLARAIGEPWWVMFFDHWRLQILLHYIGDYSQALERAVPMAVEVRKPQYEGLPQRICVHEDLIQACAGTDPVGYAERIRRALEYMEGEVSARVECYKCLQELRTGFELQLGRLDAAEAQAERSIAAAEEHPHYLTSAYSHLCQIAHRRDDRTALRRWAEVGETMARRADRQDKIIGFLAWRALVERRDGEEEAARRFYRRATSRAARLGSTPDPAYYDALAAFHEAGQRPELALKVRDRQLDVLRDKGRTATECAAGLARVRLLAQLGRPLEPAVAEVREAAGRLRDPSPVLAALNRVATGA